MNKKTVTKEMINAKLESKYYYKRYYNDSYELKEGKQSLQGLAVKLSNGKLTFYDWAVGEALPEWVYYNRYDTNAGDAIQEWVDGKLSRADVIDIIQIHLEIGLDYTSHIN